MTNESNPEEITPGSQGGSPINLNSSFFFHTLDENFIESKKQMFDKIGLRHQRRNKSQIYCMGQKCANFYRHVLQQQNLANT